MTGFLPAPFVTDAVAVGAGAMCGALCRHQIGKVAAEQIAKDPKNLSSLTGWHTAGINVLGSFILGGIFASPVVAPSEKMSSAVSAPVIPPRPPAFGLSPRSKLLLGVGFCGSFTTFSTFSVDVVNMLGKGDMAKAFAYVMTNNLGGFAAAAAGMTAMKFICKV